MALGILALGIMALGILALGIMALGKLGHVTHILINNSDIQIKLSKQSGEQFLGKKQYTPNSRTVERICGIFDRVLGQSQLEAFYRQKDKMLHRSIII